MAQGTAKRHSGRARQIGHTVLRSTTAPTDRKRVPEPDRRRAFELLVASRDGRAEALRRAMLALMRDKSDPVPNDEPGLPRNAYASEGFSMVGFLWKPEAALQISACRF